MDKRQAFIAQARSDFRAYQALCKAHDLSSCHQIERLSPAIGAGPNAEYPWCARDDAGEVTWHVPADYPFPVYHRLLQSTDGVTLLKLIELLVVSFNAVMGAR